MDSEGVFGESDFQDAERDEIGRSPATRDVSLVSRTAVSVNEITAAEASFPDRHTDECPAAPLGLSCQPD